MSRPEDMWQCQTVNCGYIYDPDRGDRKGKIPKGVKFEDLPETWRCPICGGTCKCFRPLAGPGSTLAEGCELPTAPPAKPARSAGQAGQAGPRYVCTVCGFVYDPAASDPPTAFKDLPDTWTCPVCGVEKSSFAREG